MPLTKVETLYQLSDGRKVNEKTLAAMLVSGEASYGIYSSYTPGIGAMFTLSYPNVERGINENDQEQLALILDIINRKDFSETSKQTIQNCFEKSDFLRFHLIDLMLPRNFYVPKNVLHYKLQSLTKKQQQTLFNLFLEAGAYYEHLLIHPLFNKDDLKNFIELFGPNFLNKKIVKQYPLITTFFMGDLSKERVIDGIEKLRFAVENGVDIHQSHHEHGNLLHVIIANELQFVPTIIEELEKFRQNKKCQFDYRLQDAEGKTPLLIATKLNHQLTIRALCKLSKQNIDIGINIPDQEGRTPLLIAAALGNVEAVKLLLDNGADLQAVDKEGRGIEFYMNASEQLIRSILLSIHVEPERDVNAPHNWLSFNDIFAMPLASDKSKELHHRVLISQKKEHFQLIREVYKEALDTNPDLAIHIQQQLKFLKKEQKTSILENCLEKQNEAKKEIYNYQLFEACALGDLRQVKELVAKGADLNAIDGLNRTPLHYSVMRQELVQKILTQTKSTRTIEQCMYGHIDVFDFLLKQNVNTKIKNQNGNTALGLIRNMLDESIPKKLSELDKQIANELAFIAQSDTKLSESGIATFFDVKQTRKKIEEVHLSTQEATYQKK